MNCRAGLEAVRYFYVGISKTKEELRALHKFLVVQLSTASFRTIEHHGVSYEVTIDLAVKRTLHQWLIFDVEIDLVEAMHMDEDSPQASMEGLPVVDTFQ